MRWKRSEASSLYTSDHVKASGSVGSCPRRLRTQSSYPLVRDECVRTWATWSKVWCSMPGSLSLTALSATCASGGGRVLGLRREFAPFRGGRCLGGFEVRS